MYVFAYVFSLLYDIALGVVLQVLLDENFMEYTGGQPLPMQDFGKVTRAMQLLSLIHI